VYATQTCKKRIARCLLALPLLPAAEICSGFDDVKLAVNNESGFASKLNGNRTLFRRTLFRQMGLSGLGLCYPSNLLVEYSASSLTSTQAHV